MKKEEASKHQISQGFVIFIYAWETWMTAGAVLRLCISIPHNTLF